MQYHKTSYYETQKSYDTGHGGGADYFSAKNTDYMSANKCSSCSSCGYCVL